MYRVKVSKTARKRMEKAPEEIFILFGALIQDLADKGPVLPEWPHYSKLGKEKYHCHLAYRWVACWYYEAESVQIEVYYAGSREDAPY
jgi:hypothetical protein